MNELIVPRVLGVFTSILSAGLGAVPGCHSPAPRSWSSPPLFASPQPFSNYRLKPQLKPRRGEETCKGGAGRRRRGAAAQAAGLLHPPPRSRPRVPMVQLPTLRTRLEPRGQGRQQPAGVRMTRSGREAGQAAAPPRAAALPVPAPERTSPGAGGCPVPVCGAGAGGLSRSSPAPAYQQPRGGSGSPRPTRPK